MLEYPAYWYEYLVVLVSGYCVIVSMQMVLQSYYRANLTYTKGDLFSKNFGSKSFLAELGCSNQSKGQAKYQQIGLMTLN